MLKNTMNILNFKEIKFNLLTLYHVAHVWVYEMDIKRKTNISVINDGYIELHHTGFVLGNLGLGAVMFPRKIRGKMVPVIVKESRTKSFSYNLNQFINFHELGHFENHINKETGEILDTIEHTPNNIKIEHEADWYAAEKIGYHLALDALYELRDRVAFNKYINDVLTERIIKLKEHYIETLKNKGCE